MSNEAAKLISNIKFYILNPIIGFMFAVARGYVHLRHCGIYLERRQ